MLSTIIVFLMSRPSRVGSFTFTFSSLSSVERKQKIGSTGVSRGGGVQHAIHVQPVECGVVAFAGDA
jgi:hypothetical protein